MTYRVGIIGGTGYTGSELSRLLVRHPDVELAALTSRSNAGVKVSKVNTFLEGYTDIEFTEKISDTKDLDFVMVATPYGVAMDEVPALREQGIKITGSQILQYNTLRKIADNAAVAYEQLWSYQEYEDIRNDFASRGEHIEKVLPISNKQDEMLFRQLIFPDSQSSDYTDWKNLAGDAFRRNPDAEGDQTGKYITLSFTVESGEREIDANSEILNGKVYRFIL